MPGVAEHAHGFPSIAEALYLRDRVIRQVELRPRPTTSRSAGSRCTLVVVGAGCTGRWPWDDAAATGTTTWGSSSSSGGRDAAANPLGVPLSGFAANGVTRGCHRVSMPGTRIRTAVDRTLDAVLGRRTEQLGLVRSGTVPLENSTPVARTGPRTDR